MKVRADSKRVFELRVYHATPGKVPALESRFRDTASKLLAKHDLKAIGYWVPQDAPAWDNTFIYILAHPSQEEAKKNWAAMHADRGFKRWRNPSRPKRWWQEWTPCICIRQIFRR
jgi:hypothetical protein